MGILYSEVKYYKSATVDFDDSSVNGGGIGDEIINDTLHSIFPEITATQRETGATLRIKIFVRNESTDRKMQGTIFYIKQDVQPDDKLYMYDASSETSIEDDEDFTTARKYVNSVIKTTVLEGTTTLDIPKVDGQYFAAGDSVIIVDEYFRAVYRGEIDSIADSATDVNGSTVTLVNGFTGATTISPMTGYLCNGSKQTLAPNDSHAAWLELHIEPTNAVDAEIVNQFQIGVHFDDVTA